MFKKLRQLKEEKDQWYTKMLVCGRSWQIHGLPQSGGYAFVGDRLIGYDFDTSYGLDTYQKPNAFNKIKDWFQVWKAFIIIEKFKKPLSKQNLKGFERLLKG